MRSFDELKSVSDELFERAAAAAGRWPWAVCIAMHEYYRHLYPTDPFIPFEGDEDPTERVHRVTQRCIRFLDAARGFGSYFDGGVERPPGILPLEGRTGRLYGQLWSGFSKRELTEEALEILQERLLANSIDPASFAGKLAVDIGCGSGRYTLALRRLGCSPVVGFDYGERGLRLGAETAQDSDDGRDVAFVRGNALELPFGAGTVDFVFCNGVLHHTRDLEQGLREIVRVAEAGGRIWLYLYGDGGLFWYARKEMRRVMADIPEAYAAAVLDAIGVPAARFIFMDNWYVPIERHCTDAEITGFLGELGVAEVRRLEHGRSTDLDRLAAADEAGEILWGEGELRYLIRK